MTHVDAVLVRSSPVALLDVKERRHSDLLPASQDERRFIRNAGMARRLSIHLKVGTGGTS